MSNSNADLTFVCTKTMFKNPRGNGGSKDLRECIQRRIIKTKCGFSWGDSPQGLSFWSTAFHLSEELGRPLELEHCTPVTPDVWVPIAEVILAQGLILMGDW